MTCLATLCSSLLQERLAPPQLDFRSPVVQSGTTRSLEMASVSASHLYFGLSELSIFPQTLSRLPRDAMLCHRLCPAHQAVAAQFLPPA